LTCQTPTMALAIRMRRITKGSTNAVTWSSDSSNHASTYKHRVASTTLTHLTSITATDCSVHARWSHVSQECSGKSSITMGHIALRATCKNRVRNTIAKGALLDILKYELMVSLKVVPFNTAWLWFPVRRSFAPLLLGVASDRSEASQNAKLSHGSRSWTTNRQPTTSSYLKLPSG